MSTKFNYQQVLNTFKKKVAFLKDKERQHREQLNAALGGASRVGKEFKVALKSKLHRLDAKIDAAQAAKYVKTFIALERDLVRDVAKKAKAFAKALSEIDREVKVKKKKSTPQKRSKRS